jgi:hypothetical protein
MTITYRIERDESPESPRDWDNLGTMICFHRRYVLGDKDHGFRDQDYDGWDELHAALKKQFAVILPIYMYDHSGITISTSSFSCPWDSGQIGYICVTREKILENWGGKRLTQKLIDDAERVLRGEVETYDQYLTSDVYGYVIEEDGEFLDSCWGFYGEDYCREEAEASLQHYQAKEAA